MPEIKSFEKTAPHLRLCGVVLFQIENLFLWALRLVGVRSYASESQVRDDPLYHRTNLYMGFRCQVSGVSKCRTLKPEH
jgi:hypothetical protein